ncbi:alpha/beta hydrolase [Pseudonocardia endophytica]|uniref:Acetyl esterase/lipase n=1 Tax=Pseudonocardia endophytica TaxID=401976 RepID=A0A4V2PIG9_PSEEN|nr:alpha/beta hydrolase [Pseudonocardia endophytica]TCK24616.1 acetyl esterase/lipase [Pseudonocardia endophytica]
MTTNISRPPFDPELEVALAVVTKQLPPTITPDMIPQLREATPFSVTPDEMLRQAGISRTDFRFPGHEGASLEASVLTREGRSGSGPGVLYVHGGGMISGDRWVGLPHVVPWVLDLDATVVTIEYRLAPEYPDPHPVEDCYGALVWATENAAALGIDPDRLIIAGPSAGGGLAAGAALLARDRGGPALAGQALLYPMLDDRDATVSTTQIDGVGVWDRTSNITGWSALLGDRRGTDDVSIYAAPARAVDLAGLPPTFIDCGTAEVFRDEDVAYASALWAAGVQAELHVWPGGFHGCDLMAPQAAITQAMYAARNEWVGRILSH